MIQWVFFTTYYFRHFWGKRIHHIPMTLQMLTTQSAPNSRILWIYLVIFFFVCSHFPLPLFRSTLWFVTIFSVENVWNECLICFIRWRGQRRFYKNLCKNAYLKRTTTTTTTKTTTKKKQTNLTIKKRLFEYFEILLDAINFLGPIHVMAMFNGMNCIKIGILYVKYVRYFFFLYEYN